MTDKLRAQFGSLENQGRALFYRQARIKIEITPRISQDRNDVRQNIQIALH
ncbi:MAG: hypothetical protein HWN65_23960 [Candidatus Helarchaeota archaeon]|nr:hypothetical protein [Candidatus Helarchaeota archaeon]